MDQTTQDLPWTAPEFPENESERVRVLCALNVLDTPSTPELDRITRLAAHYFDVPIALVSLIDSDRQWFMSKVGLDAPQTGRDISFCGHAILSTSALVVENAQLDSRFAGNPLVVGEPHIRFYAGHPIRTTHSMALGTLCLIDRKPRIFSKADREALADFVVLAEQYFHGLEVAVLAATTQLRLNRSEAMLSNTFSQVAVGMALVSFDGNWLRVNKCLCDIVGYTEQELLTKTFQDITHPDDLETDLAQVRKLLAGEISTYTLEKRYIRSGGESIWVKLTVSLMRDQLGAPLNFIAVINDIDARKRAEQELANLRADLEARVQERNRTLHDTVAQLQIAHEEARRNAEHFISAAESHLDGYFILKSVRNDAGEITDFRFDYINKVAETMLGLPREQVIGQLLCELLPINRTSGFFEKYVQIVNTGIPVAEEFSLDVDYVQAVWIYHEVVKIGDGISISSRNITERKRAEDNLRLQEALLRQVTDSIPVIVAFIDQEQRYRYCNRAYLESFDATDELVLGKTIAGFLGDHVYRGLQAHIATALSGKPVQFDHMRLRNGQPKQFEMHYLPQIDLDGKVDGFYVMGWDVSELRQREMTLRNRATHDTLTGLPNRAAFLERLGEELMRVRIQDDGIAILFLDIDHFKPVNDTYGHAAGDDLIREFGRRTRAAVRATDLVARMGGDEFVVLLPTVRSLLQAENVAEHIIAAMAEPAQLAKTRHKISTSIGVVYTATSGSFSAAALLEKADEALYEAKAAGRGCWRAKGM
ncbi:diguanylate cyclase domain-containing protein [Chitinimonas naiadis]